MIAGNRPINYLRISITDRCNFRCLYCIPASPFKVIGHDQIARYEEIIRITQLACEMGITKVRITGGEPFARKGIFSFLASLCDIKGLEDISITTNGSLLNTEKMEHLIQLGIKRLNFSLDTLTPEIFKTITRKNDFQKVWDTIMIAHHLGIAPLKINTVILKGINDHEIENLAALTLKYPFHIRFIEYMPMGDLPVKEDQQILTGEIMGRIESGFGKLLACESVEHDGPAKKYKIKGAKGIIGFITPISSHFCAQCNRLRLTARGTLRPCLLNDYENDIITPLRNNATDEELKKIIQDSVTRKPSCHHLADPASMHLPLSHMTSIGG
ncbi:MAG: GTP 3',8-cyclase MoaA [Proteobacteria bacterium]|nr:GTP 3',8-cyclase MoaA [Pseudomonadota bacterium]MBU1387444.1 GTP 3',8-cyclase MoaA [Pseudomonadota bacterium]MBU1541729.1 GTP 3',8-cyclase MoaA [Pseudomonadota bacterium]MBU2482935.1 GTP 3',8-cyclase MoaA [Pseudomonadota bacterium]